MADTVIFNVGSLGSANGKIVMIQVKDSERMTAGEYYTYQNGSWSGSPQCTPGNTLYIACYVMNTGDAPAYITTVVDPYGYTGSQGEYYLNPGEGYGMEVNVPNYQPGTVEIRCFES